MSIVSRLTDVLKTKRHSPEDEAAFIRLRDFYAEKREKGVAKRSEYTLPQLDTVGRRVYQAQLHKRIE